MVYQVYENLIDHGFPITTRDPEKHGPSWKNDVVGASSFYKSMLDNTLHRDADREMVKKKPTVKETTFEVLGLPALVMN